MEILPRRSYSADSQIHRWIHMPPCFDFHLFPVEFRLQFRSTYPERLQKVPDQNVIQADRDYCVHGISLLADLQVCRCRLLWVSGRKKRTNAFRKARIDDRLQPCGLLRAVRTYAQSFVPSIPAKSWAQEKSYHGSMLQRLVVHLCREGWKRTGCWRLVDSEKVGANIRRELSVCTIDSICWRFDYER